MDISTMAWKPVLLALTLVVAAPALVAAQDESANPETADAAEFASLAAPTVTVANYNWLDVHVYVARPGSGRTSLGIVTSQQSKSFELPRSFAAGAGDLRIIADPIGSDRPFVSPAFFPDPGTDFHLELQASLRLSSARLRTIATNR